MAQVKQDKNFLKIYNNRYDINKIAVIEVGRQYQDDIGMFRLRVFQPRRIREPGNYEILKELNPDVIVVVAFGQIIPTSILNLAPYGTP